MTNAEKYKIPEERTKAFVKFCHSKDCRKCPAFAQASASEIIKCLCIWLDMEAEEKKENAKQG